MLTQPDKVGEILTSLIGSFTIPVTAKIRLQPDLKDTLHLVDVIQDTGVAALAVHGRTNDVETIKKIAQHAKILIITNGGSSDNRNSETNTFQGISEFWKQSGATSVMIARAAVCNPSMFRSKFHHRNITKYQVSTIIGNSSPGFIFIINRSKSQLSLSGSSREILLSIRFVK